MTISTKQLHAHPFFEGLPEQQLATIAALAGETTFPEHTYLIRRGDAASDLYLVLDGNVSLEIEAPGRDRVVLDMVGAGGIVGFAWFLVHWHMLNVSLKY